MIYLLYLLVPISIGVMAQSWKGRTGAAWGFLTLVLMLVFGFFVDAVTIVGAQEFSHYDKTTMTMTRLFLVGGGTLVVMALIVATLPRRKT